MTVNGSQLKDGRYILVGFEENEPTAWMSGNGIEVEQ